MDTLALIILITMSCLQCALSEYLSRGEILTSLLNNTSYDPSVPPDYEKDVPTEIYVQLYIHNIDAVNEGTMDYSLTVFLRQKWMDPRLDYSRFPSIEPLEVDNRMMTKIWVPDLYFVNEKKASFHMVTVPNRLLHLYKNGTVFYSVRLSMVLSCQMNLVKYPMDFQTCPIIMESYSYSEENVVLLWYGSVPIDINRELELPQFKWRHPPTISNCSKNYGEGSQGFSSAGNFSCIRVDIHLQRDIGYFLVQIYIPTVLVVILSWVSFWLNVDAIPARITLGAMTVLTMTTQASGLRASLKKGSYIKAVDVWMAICLSFVFAALIEFAVVNVMSRKKPPSYSESRNEKPNIIEIDVSETMALNEMSGFQRGNHHSPDSVVRWGLNRAERIDRISRVSFPSVFVSLNVLYWLFYSLWHPVQHTNYLDC